MRPEDSEELFRTLARTGMHIVRFNQRSEKFMGMTLMQWCLMRRLVDRPASSAKSLAQAMGVHPSTLTQSLKRLGAKGYLFMTPDPSDHRKLLISVTRKGLIAFRSADQKRIEWGKEMLVGSSLLQSSRSVLRGLESLSSIERGPEYEVPKNKRPSRPPERTTLR